MQFLDIFDFLVTKSETLLNCFIILVVCFHTLVYVSWACYFGQYLNLHALILSKFLNELLRAIHAKLRFVLAIGVKALHLPRRFWYTLTAHPWYVLTLLHITTFFNRLVEQLQEKSPDQVDVFKTNMNKVMKDILSRFKELQFFTGESMDIDGMVGLMEYRDIDGDSVPVLMFFKHGLEEEKF